MGLVEQLGEPASRSGRGTGRRPAASPPPSTNISGSSALVRFDSPSATQRPNSSITGQRLGVARAGRLPDVLAAHVLGVAAGEFDHAARRAGRSPLRGRASPARNPTRSAPSTRVARTGRAARRGRRPCDRTRRRTRSGRAATRRWRRARHRSRCRASRGPCRSAPRPAPSFHSATRGAGGVVVDVDASGRRDAPSSPATSKWATPSRFGAACSTPSRLTSPGTPTPSVVVRLRATSASSASVSISGRGCRRRAASGGAPRRRRCRRRRAPRRGLRAADVDADERRRQARRRVRPRRTPSVRGRC